MKKSLLLLALAGSMIAGMGSCNKDETPAPDTSETYNVTLRVGESYNYTLPQSESYSAYQITTQAKHARVSTVSSDNSGGHVYSYTPAAGYSGIDQVVVSNKSASGHSCPSQGSGQGSGSQGDCSGGSGKHCTVTINFTVEDTTAAASK